MKKNYIVSGRYTLQGIKYEYSKNPCYCILHCKVLEFSRDKKANANNLAPHRHGEIITLHLPEHYIPKFIEKIEKAELIKSDRGIFKGLIFHAEVRDNEQLHSIRRISKPKEDEHVDIDGIL